jgi:putative transposase
MPRRHRVFIEGTSHHVIQRGNNRIDIFRSPSDYKVFLSFVREAALRYRIDVHAYVLMTNHVHLMVTPATATALPRAMQAFGRRYVPYFNERYKRSGSLFEGRYRSLVIDEDSYWVTCMRYVELNPVRAGLVDRPETYRWSSYRSHATGTPDAVLTDHYMYTRLGDTAGERCRSWRAICAQCISEAELTEIRGAIHRGHLPDGLVCPK